MFYLAMPGISALGLYARVGAGAGVAYRTTVGYRITSAGVSQIKRELEEAAAVCGSPWLTTFRRVVLPRCGPLPWRCGLLTFIVNFRELTIALLLGGVDNMMLGPAALAVCIEQRDGPGIGTGGNHGSRAAGGRRACRRFVGHAGHLDSVTYHLVFWLVHRAP